MPQCLNFYDIYLSVITFNNFSLYFGGSVTRNSLSNFNLLLVIVINKGGVIKARNVSLTEGSSSSNYEEKNVSWRGRKWEKY